MSRNQNPRNAKRIVIIIDVAFLPTGNKYTLDDVEVAEAAEAISPKFVIPMHCRDTDPKEFREKVEAKSEVKVLLLKEGEEFKLTN